MKRLKTENRNHAKLNQDRKEESNNKSKTRIIKQSPSDLWDNYKQYDVYTIGIP